MRLVAAMTVGLAVLVGGCNCCSEGAPMKGGKGRVAIPVPRALARVNCGADKPYTDADGAAWQADRELAGDASWGAVGGRVVTRTGLKIACPKRPELYVTERYGMEAYQFSVPNGTYAVRLHFAETFDRITQPGQRVFAVKINGKTVLGALDVLKVAGGQAKPLVLGFDDLAVTDGKLRIDFVADVQNPEINAIEVLRY